MGFCLVFAVTSGFWGPSATSKGVKNVDVLSGPCFLGLVVAIVSELGPTAVVETQS